jgi:hypothetical protein
MDLVGGTCQVSAWDHVFLGLFWMYNSLSIAIFHFSWKMQSDVWGVSSGISHITVVILLKVQIQSTVGYVISYGHNHHKLFNHTVLLYQRGLIS